MKFVVQDINEITDSRELLESKPHPFTSIFVYILLTLLCSALIWSWFSEKEIVIKATGVVKPREDVYKITSMYTGKVDNIKYTNGQSIKAGDILFTIDHSDLDIQKKSYSDKVESIKQDIDNLNKLKSSILDGKNYFDKNNDKEKDYYNKYLNYEKNNQISLSGSDTISTSKADLNSKIDSYNLLLKSIGENKNYLSQGSIYSEQFNNFQISKKQLEDKLSDAQKAYNSIKSNNNIDQATSNAAKDNVDSCKTALDKFISDYKININSTIEDLKAKVKDLDSSLSKLNGDNSLTKDKNKSNVLSQIDDSIKSNNDKLKDLQDSLKQIDMNLDKCTIKASNDGVLDTQVNLNVGDVVQVGSVIANILPPKSSYKVDLYIADKDIGNIKSGQDVKYSFPSMPYEEYGFIPGDIKKVSADSKVDEKTGISFYTGEGEINKTVVSSHKGEKVEIKSGMTCEAKIISRREKMLYYLLEKINLKD